MTWETDDLISTLNNLIETCKDGEQGFRQAAEGVKDPDLKALFNSYSRQRAQFAADLQAEVRRLGGDPEKMGSVAGALHRGWINIKSAVTGQDEEAVIAEAERGEDAAVKNYQEALNKDLPADLRVLIERQYMQIKEAHDRVRALEVATAH
ncbi:MAG: PA2169 family four-helix-bundle protein [Acidobacteria bacterium]|nr:PA2169 family four-helix-bundle protein [Acidobacteriota bacterium]